jgi:hypothetical protein
MTDPLQSYDLELLKRYDAEQQELESLSPAAIELPAVPGSCHCDPYANRCGKPSGEI